MSSPTSPPVVASTAVGRTLPVWLVLVCIALLALNFRPAAVSVGPVLAEVRETLGLSPAAASLLTSLPVLAFAVFGALAPWLARLVGLHRISMLSLLAVTVGLGLRSFTDSGAVFLVLTFLAVGGVACANVLTPSLVKLHFPDRIGMATSLYTTSMATGLTLALVATVPLSEAMGGWRAGLGTWAVVSAVCLLPWIALVVREVRTPQQGRTRIAFTQVARTRLGWAMAGFFGVQSTIAYSLFGWSAQLWRDNGYSAAHAGVLVGIIAAMGIPCSLILPTLLARVPQQKYLLWAVIAIYPPTFTGMLLAPDRLGELWAVLLGIGGTTFPLILVMIGLRARTPEGTAALSGFTQSVGYTLATPGTFIFGLIHTSTGGWTAPIWFLFALLIPLTGFATYVARGAQLEDQIKPRQA